VKLCVCSLDYEAHAWRGDFLRCLREVFGDDLALEVHTLEEITCGEELT